MTIPNDINFSTLKVVIINVEPETKVKINREYRLLFMTIWHVGGELGFEITS